MATFKIHGPFRLDFEKRKGGRALVFDNFWLEDSDAAYLSLERGCYVFAIRNRGLTPIYVGKAEKTFKQEAFNDSNKTKYQNGFSEYAKGTPVMYFVVHPSQKGPTNSKEIRQIEDFLIQAGALKNPDLQNIRGIQRPNWCIKGVIRSRAGKRSNAELQFNALFDITT